MRTILDAIVDVAPCAEQSKDCTSQVLRGVVIDWYDLPESDHLPERVLRARASDGSILAVNLVDPMGWQVTEPVIISADGIKIIKAFHKRVAKLIDDYMPAEPISARLEEWHDGVTAEGLKIRARQVLRLDVVCANEGVVVPLVAGAAYDVNELMKPRRLRLGVPGPLSTGYLVTAQEAVGGTGPATVYTDGRSAYLFNPDVDSRSHDFAMVMPMTGIEAAQVIAPWGEPTEATP